MSGAWTLGRKPSQAHELIGAAQVHRFAKVFLNPVLNHFAAPDDALVKILAQTGGELLLLRLSQDRGCAWIVGAAISQTVQSQGVIPMQHLARTGHGILRQGQKFSLTLAFGKKRKKLCPAPSNGAGAGPENGPEVGSGVLKFNRRMKGFDPWSLHFLIGVRIIRSVTH